MFTEDLCQRGREAGRPGTYVGGGGAGGGVLGIEVGEQLKEI